MFTLEFGILKKAFSQQCKPQRIGLGTFLRITNKIKGVLEDHWWNTIFFAWQSRLLLIRQEEIFTVERVCNIFIGSWITLYEHGRGALRF